MSTTHSVQHWLFWQYSWAPYCVLGEVGYRRGYHGDEYSPESSGVRQSTLRRCHSVDRVAFWVLSLQTTFITTPTMFSKGCPKEGLYVPLPYFFSLPNFQVCRELPAKSRPHQAFVQGGTLKKNYLRHLAHLFAKCYKGSKSPKFSILSCSRFETKQYSLEVQA